MRINWMVAKAGDETYAVFGLCIIGIQKRQAEKMRRGKEILNRYRPERNPRPLGL